MISTKNRKTPEQLNQLKKPIIISVNSQLDAWAKASAPSFEASGLSKAAAYDCARHYIHCWSAGINPQLRSTYRPAAYNLALQQRYDRGDRQGLRARPASNSKHTLTGLGGRPAAKAWDMTTTDDRKAVAIAKELRIGCGASFTDPDPGHYFTVSG